MYFVAEMVIQMISNTRGHKGALLVAVRGYVTRLAQRETGVAP